MTASSTDRVDQGKRPYNFRPRNKRKKLKTQQTVENIVANVVFISRPFDVIQNKVWLNEHDYQMMKPWGHDDNTPLYVQISNRVYSAIGCSHLEPNTIGLNYQQYNEVESALNDDGDAIVSLFIPTEENYQPLKRAIFDVSYDDEEELDYEESREDIYVDAIKFDQDFKAKYGKQMFKNGQTIVNYYNNNPINITLIKSRGHTPPSNYEIFGMITEETDLIFKSTEMTNIKFYSLPDPSHFKFKFDVIIKYNTDHNNLEGKIRRIIENRFMPLEDTISSYPFIVDADKLAAHLRSEFSSLPLCEGDIKKVKLKGGGHLAVRLFDVQDLNQTPSNIRTVNRREFEYEKAYNLNQFSEIEIFSGSSHLVFTKGKPKVAQYVSLRVVDVNEDRSYSGWEMAGKNWINGAEFIKKVQTHLKEFVYCTQFEIEFEGVSFRVEIDKIDSVSRGKRSTAKTTYTPCWKFGSSTKVNLDITPDIERIFVEDDKGYPIKSIKVNLEPSKSLPSSKEVWLNMADIEEAFRKAAPKKLCLNQEFVIDLGPVGRFDATVDSMIFNETEFNNSINLHLGTLTEETKFEFLHTENFKVEEIEQPLDLSDPFKAMESLGLTGLPKGGRQLLEDILYSLDPEGIKIGFKKPRGVILSGPPGTGKTTFVQNLGKMLGIPKSRFNMISGTTPLSKWVGQSEKNIRKLFQPAIDDPKHLYFLFIDELDGLMSKRSENTPNQNKVVNEFLSQMDGVHRPPNLMVFATTNHKALIDEACFRPGRFERIVDFSLPTRKETLDILKLHCKSLNEEKLIGSDVDFEHIASLAEGMSGAHIRGIVEEAKKAYFRRSRNKKNRRFKICQEDLIKGYQAVQENRKDRENVDPIIKGEILDPAERPRETFERIGPVGLPDEILDYIDSLAYAVREGREYAKQIGFKFPRGILIHGRPGIGKTMLAKSITHVLDVPPHRIKILTGSDFLNNDRRIERNYIYDLIAKFKSEDPEDHNLRVLILENFRNMKSENLDQLFKLLQEESHLDNLLVIATCNVIDLHEDQDRSHILQEATIPTRFQKVIELNPPKEAQRLKILNFHLKDLEESDSLHSDVDINELVRLSAGHSGSWIQSFIDDAKSCNINRIQDEEDEEQIKLMRIDFINAYARRASGTQLTEGDPPESMYY